jgi:hypothetical protein
VAIRSGRKNTTYFFSRLSDQELRTAHLDRANENVQGIRTAFVDHIKSGEIKHYRLLASNQVCDTVDGRSRLAGERAAEGRDTAPLFEMEIHHERIRLRFRFQGR